MIRHIVFFKVKEENKQANIDKLKIALRELKGKISEIKSIDVGVNFNAKSNAFDIALITDFQNIEDLDKYRVHPEHQKVVELIKEITEKSAVVDYEF